MAIPVREKSPVRLVAAGFGVVAGGGPAAASMRTVVVRFATGAVATASISRPQILSASSETAVRVDHGVSYFLAFWKVHEFSSTRNYGRPRKSKEEEESEKKNKKKEQILRKPLEVAKVRKTYQLLKSDDHANFLRKNGRDPAHYRPDITHQAILMILDSSVNKAGRLKAMYNRTKQVGREKLMEVIKNHVKDLTAVEYVEDICFYKYVEIVYVKFELNPEMFDFTVNIMDRLVSAEPLLESWLESSALLISSKSEEIWPPHGEDLVDIADHAYSHKQLLVMERQYSLHSSGTFDSSRHYVFLMRHRSFHCRPTNGEYDTLWRS
ncbi:hypothetical protein Bca52824_051129 [Brassica carinata]|uniref:Cyclin-like domain-containing protein n=1 Tax=Brassica carinata TaxID=52824 RepID=A0A8X7R7F6_BRACI|nr:hypothetical protein Bca52824_051129 [Brassica carinata]